MRNFQFQDCFFTASGPGCSIMFFSYLSVLYQTNYLFSFQDYGQRCKKLAALQLRFRLRSITGRETRFGHTEGTE